MRFIFVKLFLISILLSSCGVITKARYGNGYKLNIEFGNDKEQKLAQKTNIAKRKAQLSPVSDVQNGVENTVAAVVDAAKLEEKQHTETVPAAIHKHENQSPETVVLNKKESTKKESRFVKKLKQGSKFKPNKTTRDPRPLNRNVIYSLLAWGLSFLFSFIPLFLIFPIFPILSILTFLLFIASIVFSIMAISNIRRNGYAEKGMFLALFILIMQILSLIFTIIVFLIIFALLL